MKNDIAANKNLFRNEVIHMITLLTNGISNEDSGNSMSIKFVANIGIASIAKAPKNLEVMIRGQGP